MNARFKICEEKFFNNGKIILNAIPEVENNIRRALSRETKLSLTNRKEKGKTKTRGISADSLNKALRECLSLESEAIRGETHIENGIFFHDKKEGFDFSIYDEKYNMARLYNYYQGSVGILDGEKKIKDLYDKMGYDEKEWRGKIKAIRSKVQRNTDYTIDKELLTVAGELQFGNWALIYRDLFRLLDADNNPGIDFYIYVTAGKDLSKLISANTVSYKSAEKVINESLSIIKTPIWLIGLGFDEI